jgi:beta-lactamase regulating signal transducer with metallopeptidase domain
MTIPKGNVPSGSTPIVYIDGVLAANQGYTQDANNYYVWFTTSFSIHQVQIEFAGPTPTSFTPSALSSASLSSPTNSNPTGFSTSVWGFIVFAIIAAVVVVSVFTVHSRRKPRLNSSPI